MDAIVLDSRGGEYLLLNVDHEDEKEISSQAYVHLNGGSNGVIDYGGLWYKHHCTRIIRIKD